MGLKKKTINLVKKVLRSKTNVSYILKKNLCIWRFNLLDLSQKENVAKKSDDVTKDLVMGKKLLFVNQPKASIDPTDGIHYQDVNLDIHPSKTCFLCLTWLLSNHGTTPISPSLWRWWDLSYWVSECSIPRRRLSKLSRETSRTSTGNYSLGGRTLSWLKLVWSGVVIIPGSVL